MAMPVSPVRLLNFRHPAKIPPTYCKYIGHVVSAWMYTEIHMMNIVWHVFGIRDPAAGRVTTWGQNASDKVKLFKSLTGSKRFPKSRWISDPVQQKELTEIAGEADRIRSERNKLAHGLWSLAPGARSEYRILFMREVEHKLLPPSIKMPLSKLKKLASDLDALNKRLNAFRRTVGARVP